jgi:hypothetical protein
VDDGLRHFALQEMAEGCSHLGSGRNAKLIEELGNWIEDLVSGHGPAAACVMQSQVQGGQASFIGELFLGKSKMGGFQAGEGERVVVADHGDAADDPGDPELDEGVSLVEKRPPLAKNGQSSMGLTRSSQRMREALDCGETDIRIGLNQIQCIEVCLYSFQVMACLGEDDPLLREDLCLPIHVAFRSPKPAGRSQATQSLIEVSHVLEE